MIYFNPERYMLLRVGRRACLERKGSWYEWLHFTTLGGKAIRDVSIRGHHVYLFNLFILFVAQL